MENGEKNQKNIILKSFIPEWKNRKTALNTKKEPLLQVIIFIFLSFIFDLFTYAFLSSSNSKTDKAREKSIDSVKIHQIKISDCIFFVIVISKTDWNETIFIEWFTNIEKEWFSIPWFLKLKVNLIIYYDLRGVIFILYSSRYAQIFYDSCYEKLPKSYLKSLKFKSFSISSIKLEI